MRGKAVKARLKQPVNLWWLSITYALFMCAFGSIQSCLSLYLTNKMHLSLKETYSVYAVFASFLWTLPLAGGYLSSKLGYKQAAGVGLGFCLLGALSLIDSNLMFVYLGIAAFVVGNALFTPALWCLVDFSYSKTDTRREAGFTLFYLAFNVGAVLAIFGGGFIAQTIGYSATFALDAVFVAAALFIFSTKITHMKFDRSRQFILDLNLNNSSIALIMYIACLAAIPVSIIFFNHFSWATDVLYALSISAVIVILKIAFEQKKKIAKFKVIGFLMLTLVSLAFWTLYNLEPSMMSVFVSHNVARELLGINMPAESFIGFEAAAVVVIGLLFSRIWMYLGVKGKDPAMSFKFALGILVMGFAFIYLFEVIKVDGLTNVMPIKWALVAYILFACAELLIAPIGISMVGRLSPHGQEGLFMGVWQLFEGLAAIIGGYISKSTVLPATASLAASNSTYAKTFCTVGLAAVAIGIVALGFAPKIKKVLSTKS